MANKNDKNDIKFGSLKKIANLIQSNSDDIYKTTHYSDPENKQQLQDLKTSIDNSIKSIMGTNMNNVGEPSISKMYERIFMKSQNDPETNREFERIFNDNEFMNSLTNSYLDNRYVKAQDDELNDILRYMPKLQEAILTLRDNVLSSDSFNKDFLNIATRLGTGENNIDTFSNNISELKKRYDLLKLVTDTYTNASTYGEEFIYIVPYKKAIETLLQRKQNNPSNVIIKSNIRENKIYMEDSSGKTEYDTSIKNINESNKDISFNITFDKSGMIKSIVESEYEINKKKNKLNEMSLCEQFYSEIADSSTINEGFNNNSKKFSFDNTYDSEIEYKGKLPVHHKFDETLDDDLELPVNDDTTADGLVTKTKSNLKIKNMNGCIVKRLKRERVTPIYINDECLGYYYFEFDEKANIFEDRYTTTGMTNTITGLRSNGRSEALDAQERREELIRYLASELAEKIDAEFVNANQDLKKEIYYILKYNDEYYGGTDQANNIRVTYIPPEDIQHVYFNLNEGTNRGVSDLALSLVPAKLWCSIYITNCLAVMTRSNDKRVYYVKQSVESNISKTLLKTINEIKKSNFGMRQIENINNVLDITGRFNDYIIPRSADGQSPIDFEVMQGQQVEIKTDLLNILEESAINPTGVPIELIQNRQSPEYAVQFTMSNSKFLRFVYTRQSQYEAILSQLITKIYNIEYGSNDDIKVTLPPPLFINLTNTNQLITNVTDFSNAISNIVLADEPDDTVKAIFVKEYTIYNLGSYINMNAVNDIINKAKQKAEKLKADAKAKESSDMQ